MKLNTNALTELILESELQVIGLGVVVPVELELHLHVLSPAHHQPLLPRQARVVVHLPPWLHQLVGVRVVAARIAGDVQVHGPHVEDLLLRRLRGRWGPRAGDGRGGHGCGRGRRLMRLYPREDGKDNWRIRGRRCSS